VLLNIHPPLDAERLRQMLDALAIADAGLRVAIARVGYPAPRQRDPGFATLLRIILAQQVSTASAAAMWRKLEAALGGEVDPVRFLTLDDAALRAAGFSARKAEYARGLCREITEGALDVELLAQLEEEAAIEALVRLRGFGRWSAEVYLLFALGRADVFPADDLAVQIAYQRLRRLDVRPTAKSLRAMTESWRPYRGAAAVFLWHYYGAATLDGQ
jgi:DNA-3-methyladenine glycosylase II